MLADVAISPVASLLADPTRVAILLALSDGREVPAGELALVAGVTGALGAALLTRLVDQGWIERTPASRAVEVTLAGRRGLHRTLGFAG